MRRIAISALSLLLLPLACSREDSAADVPPRAAAGARADSGAPVTPMSVPVDVQVRIVLAADVRAGAVVPMVLRVTNAGSRVIDLYLRGRQPTVDVIVSQVNGDVVWQRLEGEVIPAIVHLEALAPGESLEHRVTWDQRARDGSRVPAGEYFVRAALLTEDAPGLLAPPAPLRIR